MRDKEGTLSLSCMNVCSESDLLIPHMFQTLGREGGREGMLSSDSFVDCQGSFLDKGRSAEAFVGL